MDSVPKFFIGIDVSKPYFDASLLPVADHVKGAIVTGRFDNTIAGVKDFDKWLKSNKVTFNNEEAVTSS